MSKKIIIVAAIAIAAIAGFLAFKPKQANTEVVATEVDLPIHLADRVLGDANASVTIIEYTNFTCPHCSDFHETVFKKLKTEYIDTGKVKMIHREVITDGPGLLGTSLARCLPENQYYGMADVLYKNAQEWAFGQEDIDGVKTALRKYANLAGLSSTELDKCFDDTAKQEEILEHFRGLAVADKVQGTPSLYIDGKATKGWQWDSLKDEIEAALK